MAATLGSKAVGSTVKLKVGGIALNFIVVNQGTPSSLYDDSCNGTWLLMEDIYEKRQWHSSDVNDYENSEIHKYLNGDFLKKFDSNIRSQIKTVKLPYRKGYGYGKTVTSGAKGLSAQVFLLSSTEVGFVSSNIPPNEGAVLSYFNGCAANAADPKRVANLSGAAVVWWLRSPYVHSLYGDAFAVCVSAKGDNGHYYCVNTDCAIRPALVLPSTLYVSDDGTVTTNTAPSTPSSISVPSDISGGTNISLSWAASTDAESNLYGYIVEKSVDGGSSWTQIYQGPATSTTDAVAFGTDTVMYRVKAYDTEGLESGWRTSGQVTVVNNNAPTAPASITVPLTVIGGADLVISWGAAEDSDGNLSGYELERQHDGGEWEQLCRENVQAYTDHIVKGWQTVAYRVRAYDDLDVAGPYKTSDTRTVNNNTAPVITCDAQSGTDLGVKAAGFTVNYSVSDVDSDAVTVAEAIDGAVKRSFEATLGQEYSFQITGETFMKLLNGKRLLTITADDGKASTVHKLTFTKEVTEATITLETPFEADDKITICVLSIVGHIPADADLKVEVTNNANDDAPEWEDCTTEVKNGGNHIFANQDVKNGNAFNFKVTVKRGESGEGGYINSVQGGFQ